jgi:hypothetical protein
LNFIVGSWGTARAMAGAPVIQAKATAEQMAMARTAVVAGQGLGPG